MHPDRTGETIMPTQTFFLPFGKLVNHYFLLVFTSKNQNQKLVTAEIKTSKKTNKFLVFEKCIEKSKLR